MSLLMEALRKAEEAKSKAANKDHDSVDPEGTQASPSLSDLEINETPDSLSAESGSSPELEQGPVTINPDPDEAETLASHLSEDSTSPPTGSGKSRLDELTVDDLTLVDLEDESAPPSATDPTASNSYLDEGEDDNELSLLQSSYFSRTQQKSSQFADPELVGLDDDEEYKSEFIEEDFPQAPENTALNRQEPSGTDAQQDAADTAAKIGMSAAQAPHSEQDQPASRHDSRRESQAREQQNRSSASAVFLAKEDTQKRRLKRLLSVAAALLIIPLAGGMFWVYTSLTSTPQVQFTIPAGGLADRGFLGGDNGAANQPDTTTPATDLAATALATDTDNPVSESGNDILPSTESEAEANANQQSASAPDTQAVNNPQVATAAAQAETTPQQPDNPTPVPAQNTQQTAASEVPADANTAENTGLSFVRRETRTEINPDLNAAYDSYRQGDMTAAGRLYQQVLGSEPNNRDAMLGLASVYLTQNNIAMSQNLYARLLELNPRDPIARAGLLDTALRDDPVRQENELKSLIGAYPSMAPLSFALGNLYAAQNRWNEAQSAYFTALLTARSGNAGPVSPDYAFNLAVSLERLNQLRPALDYYREAAEFSRNAAPGFDTALLNQRLEYLEQRLR